MRTILKVTLGFFVMGIAGCGGPSQTDVAEEGTVGEQTSALTYTEVSKGIRHDFNKDGIEDLVFVQPPDVTAPSQLPGTSLLLGTWLGGFSAPNWHHDSVATNVTYVPGDFNGDHRTDLIIVTPNGSFEYLRKSDGTFQADTWVRYDLTRDNTEYVVGDFNNDGRSDLIITTPNGTWEYLGRADVGFDSYWSHGMPKGSVKYTTSDFNGDGTTDLIFTHAGGTTLYTGTAGTTGGFTPNVWISYDCVMNDCTLFPGDFNGDGKFDLIVQTGTSARELLGSASGVLTTTTWVHNEYGKVNQVNFVPGDYTGDGKWDIVVAEGSGTSIFAGLWNGGFGPRIWYRTGFDSYHSAFIKGDFSGDSRDDLLIFRETGTYEYLGDKDNGLGRNNVWSKSFFNLQTDVY